MNKKYIALIAGVLSFLLFLFTCLGTIPQGGRGVLLRFGALKSVMKEGLYVKLPFVDSIYIMDCRTQKYEFQTEAASKDLQSVPVVIALNYNVDADPSAVEELFSKVGMLYEDKLISPALSEAVKATTAKYTAEELITKREVVRSEIQSVILEKMKSSHIEVSALNIVHFNFSPVFNAAIELKVTAEQQALAAKNKLAQVEFESQQRIQEAKGKAEAMRLESEVMKQSPAILELRAIEKWDGKLPNVTGGGVPFVNVESKK